MSAEATGPAETDAEGKPVFKIVITGKRAEAAASEAPQSSEHQSSSSSESNSPQA